ncbi:hypothetical protein Taro_004699 [Colocasia esculenta]|uniref:t-SNARE coiled-coil homology domain-containing protein n=1 Tax=Colocasia esculenta TaxID=4460 RepID=A0A843TSG1_COLES|nr:hypothetical protein [Colocasia esculenta]
MQDQGLDVIAEGLDTLKNMAHDMNEELDRQVPLMDEIDTKVEKATADLKNTNVRLKHTVNQGTLKEKMTTITIVHRGHQTACNSQRNPRNATPKGPKVHTQRANNPKASEARKTAAVHRWQPSTPRCSDWGGIRTGAHMKALTKKRTELPSRDADELRRGDGRDEQARGNSWLSGGSSPEPKQEEVKETSVDRGQGGWGESSPATTPHQRGKKGLADTKPTGDAQASREALSPLDHIR